MTPIDLREVYFHWILQKVGADENGHMQLMRYLFNKEFHYTMIMDANRSQDGISLRYHFGYECAIPDMDIAVLIDQSECSVLEMIAALAIRSETDMMYNSMLGDRTYIWFWDMIESLGLKRYDDAHFPKRESTLNRIVDRFINREYEPSGRGGIITLSNPFVDMRTVDIWTQLSFKQNEYLEQWGG